MKIPGITILFIILAMNNFSCADAAEKTHGVHDTIPVTHSSKPPSNYQDTLIIEGPAAVFYSPDSLQLVAIRSRIDKGIFESTMHEYENQLRVSHLELKEQWKDIHILEARNTRFLCFRQKNGTQTWVDLDKQGDPYGLYAFDPRKEPQKIDMMNAGTQLYYYFK